MAAREKQRWARAPLGDGVQATSASSAPAESSPGSQELVPPSPPPTLLLQPLALGCEAAVHWSRGAVNKADAGAAAGPSVCQHSRRRSDVRPLLGAAPARRVITAGPQPRPGLKGHPRRCPVTHTSPSLTAPLSPG